MSNLIVHGGTPLRGRITPSANKNAVLPILCATLLTREPLRLHGVPDITDVRKILDIFRTLGSEVQLDHATGTLALHHRDTVFDAAAHRLPEEMRSSIMLVPPLLARFGVARLEDNVKGCTLGVREIDPHVEVFRSFGGQVERAEGSLLVRTAGRLVPTDHWLDYASVTTTENFVLCAVGAEGTSTLTNAASEPHVQEFCRFMAMIGARIDGIGTSRLTVHGGHALGGGEFRFDEDFHEITTFLALGAITGGDVVVRNSAPANFPLIDRTFAKFGVQIVHEDGWSRAVRSGPLKVQTPFTANVLTKVEAAPWPYFPVDLLPIFIALGVRAQGNAMFWNKVYDGALGWTGELSKFGAHVFSSDPHRLITFGGAPLVPAVVESPYIIRVAIALFMVASSIEGRSEIRNATPIRRAHPRFVENLRSLGVQVEWTSEE
ncbi:UDP-N-acetylglucosamine 1-carboxyvinyltransferase [Variovorax paradoxus]|jgi:UDP-N-acetylglucosamine 1-carboxyvinyltransferase|uniref:UDP-N-acetylglucosamine 1-carboxyvinyltransferase n=1 Tax=Variovorax TaxID=34072 RepID=UPI0006E5D86B|nr:MULTISPECIES: UDP-N-acetylglucosamine 1-carboxyvinyltransferase [unclassified Variovorax]KPU88517.1 UDP-N-acetylglucosamine 1-carboxyvinyltransferase [Variovorax paradoxus]KPU90147.1 UDP-N-acetylglucosamine 1-carboxyvinyltransferase [Variovorax paradoxus]KPU92358.1 UDP-N-acetylglucosamine 1-carboxyvinyltransferase [Variovorax paradoxus]KPV16031.1 UDP-N-acetylglucosamine 1-carboxyvinyltransferase [Variovorax paradoxus]KPV16260.1 UDP-N-acetylglucosamine 1-carboxyvinyltransferase [Variovorax p